MIWERVQRPKRQKNVVVWHAKFTWLPTRITPRWIAWLRWVERKLVVDDMACGQQHWEYRWHAPYGEKSDEA